MSSIKIKIGKRKRETCFVYNFKIDLLQMTKWSLGKSMTEESGDSNLHHHLEPMMIWMAFFETVSS